MLSSENVKIHVWWWAYNILQSFVNEFVLLLLQGFFPYKIIDAFAELLLIRRLLPILMLGTNAWEVWK